MVELIGSFLSGKGYLPHGYCFTWTPSLLWSMVVSDAVIALSYFSIPAVIVSFYAKRPDLQYRGVAALFGLFIMACGVTHVLAIWTIWVPHYGAEAITKMITAVVSLVTAAALWPLLPKALKIPSVQQLQQAIASLEAEVRKRKTAEEHLHDTEQSLAATLNSIGAGFIRTDAQGRISRINDAALALVGLEVVQAQGLPLREVLRQEEGSAEFVPGLFDSIGSLLERSGALCVSLSSAAGRVALVELKTSLTFAPDGTANGATLLLRDITEQRVAEEARIKSEALEVENRQIQETSRVKSLFLANMSHELRTPLNSIIGFAELLETGVVPPDSPRYHHFLGNISRSGAHLLRLINDVLDLSKVDAGKLSFSPQPVQLDRTVDDVVTSMGTDIAAKSLRVTQSVDAGIGVVMIDEGRFRQVLYNYLSNAVKFTPAGGDISLRATLEGADHFRLEVQDSGAGIEPKDLERLFVEFQQLDSSFTRQHQGTGLGLALTRKLVEAQGGSVGVRSTVGQGSVFHLVLPRQTQAINVD